MITLTKSRFHGVIRGISLIIITAFITTSVVPAQRVYAQELNLPVPGSMVNLSPVFEPALIQGIKIAPNNPLLFNFLIDPGQVPLSQTAKKAEYHRLITYFLAALTTPEKDLWVNLSPYEHGRIISLNFGHTEMGRDMLAQDYILKQLSASLVYPEDGLGKKFWDTVYEKVREQNGGNAQIPVNTFNKVWIVPDTATVFERGNVAIITQSHLKVLMEEDYLALNKHDNAYKMGLDDINSLPNNTHQISSQVMREIIIPAVEQEINEGKNFAQLRQMYNSMILATWFKKTLKMHLLNKIYANKNMNKGVELQNPQDNEQIFQRYIKAYKKGVYNYIKEESDPLSGQLIPRKYFSGGFAGRAMVSAVRTTDNPNSLAMMSNKMLNWVPASLVLAGTLLFASHGYAAGTNQGATLANQTSTNTPSITVTTPTRHYSTVHVYKGDHLLAPQVMHEPTTLSPEVGTDGNLQTVTPTPVTPAIDTTTPQAPTVATSHGPGILGHLEANTVDLGRAFAGENSNPNFHRNLFQRVGASIVGAPAHGVKAVVHVFHGKSKTTTSVTLPNGTTLGQGSVLVNGTYELDHVKSYKTNFDNHGNPDKLTINYVDNNGNADSQNFLPNQFGFLTQAPSVGGALPPPQNPGNTAVAGGSNPPNSVSSTSTPPTVAPAATQTFTQSVGNVQTGTQLPGHATNVYAPTVGPDGNILPSSVGPTHPILGKILAPGVFIEKHTVATVKAGFGGLEKSVSLQSLTPEQTQQVITQPNAMPTGFPTVVEHWNGGTNTFHMVTGANFETNGSVDIHMFNHHKVELDIIPSAHWNTNDISIFTHGSVWELTAPFSMNSDATNHFVGKRILIFGPDDKEKLTTGRGEVAGVGHVVTGDDFFQTQPVIVVDAGLQKLSGLDYLQPGDTVVTLNPGQPFPQGPAILEINPQYEPLAHVLHAIHGSIVKKPKIIAALDTETTHLKSLGNVDNLDNVLALVEELKLAKKDSVAKSIQENILRQIKVVVPSFQPPSVTTTNGPGWFHRNIVHPIVGTPGYIWDGMKWTYHDGLKPVGEGAVYLGTFGQVDYFKTSASTNAPTVVPVASVNNPTTPSVTTTNGPGWFHRNIVHPIVGTPGYIWDGMKWTYHDGLKPVGEGAVYLGTFGQVDYFKTSTSTNAPTVMPVASVNNPTTPSVTTTNGPGWFHRNIVHPIVGTPGYIWDGMKWTYHDGLKPIGEGAVYLGTFGQVDYFKTSTSTNAPTVMPVASVNNPTTPSVTTTNGPGWFHRNIVHPIVGTPGYIWDGMKWTYHDGLKPVGEGAVYLGTFGQVDYFKTSTSTNAPTVMPVASVNNPTTPSVTTTNGPGWFHRNIVHPVIEIPGYVWDETKGAYQQIASLGFTIEDVNSLKVHDSQVVIHIGDNIIDPDGNLITGVTEIELIEKNHHFFSAVIYDGTGFEEFKTLTQLNMIRVQPNGNNVPATSPALPQTQQPAGNTNQPPAVPAAEQPATASTAEQPAATPEAPTASATPQPNLGTTNAPITIATNGISGIILNDVDMVNKLIPLGQFNPKQIDAIQKIVVAYIKAQSIPGINQNILDIHTDKAIHDVDSNPHGDFSNLPSSITEGVPISPGINVPAGNTNGVASTNANPAAVSKLPVGGIDFDSSYLKMNIEGDSAQISAPRGFEWLLHTSISGFYPRILDIRSGVGFDMAFFKGMLSPEEKREAANLPVPSTMIHDQMAMKEWAREEKPMI